jgi:hypothetical protein
MHIHSSCRIFVPIVFILLFSCGNQEEDSQDSDYIIRTFNLEDVPAPDTLRGKKLNLTDLINPQFILWTGKYLVVGERNAFVFFYQLKCHSINVLH